MKTLLDPVSVLEGVGLMSDALRLSRVHTLSRNLLRPAHSPKKRAAKSARFSKFEHQPFRIGAGGFSVASRLPTKPT
jgi:hypothetical protein